MILYIIPSPTEPALTNPTPTQTPVTPPTPTTTPSMKYIFLLLINKHINSNKI